MTFLLWERCPKAELTALLLIEIYEEHLWSFRGVTAVLAVNCKVKSQFESVCGQSFKVKEVIFLFLPLPQQQVSISPLLFDKIIGLNTTLTPLLSFLLGQTLNFLPEFRSLDG